VSNAEIYLGHGPLERCACAGSFLQGFATGADGVLQPRRPALPLAEHSERSAEIILGRGPIAGKTVPGPQLGQMAIALDRRQRRHIIPKFIALQAKRIGLFVKVFPAFVFMPLRHFCRRPGKVPRCFRVAQLGQGHIAELGGGLRGIEREAFERLVLDLLDPGQNFFRLVEFSILDRPLRLRLQRGDFCIVAGLRRRRRLQVLVFRGDLQKLRPQPLGRNVRFTDDFQGAPDLVLVEIEVTLQLGDLFLLGFGEFLPRPGERGKHLRGNASYECAVRSIAAYCDASLPRLNRGAFLRAGASEG
jgi:hypothetical protein